MKTKTINKYSLNKNELPNSYNVFRTIKNLFWTTILLLLSIISVGFTGLIIFFVIVRGFEHFHVSMLWKNYDQNELVNKNYTGIAGPLISTMLMLFLVLLISVTTGLFSSIYLSEFCKNRKLKKIIIYFCSICNGVPSIIFGMFGLLIFVSFIHFSRVRWGILSASFTLSLVVLPTIILGCYESIKSVSQKTRLNSFCLGASKTQTILKIILPTAITGIIGTIIVSASRAVGEAAPVLFTIGGSNEIPKSATSAGNTLTLLLFDNFKNPQSTSFLFSIALVIFLMCLLIVIFFRLLNIYFSFSNKEKLSLKKIIKNAKNFYFFLETLKYKIKVLYYSIINLFKKEEI